MAHPTTPRAHDSRSAARTLTALALALLATTASGAAPPVPSAPILLEVDATDVQRAIVHAHLVIPARPGLMTLAYPEWIPGEQLANGPITEVVNLAFSAGGKTLAWRRDPASAFLFRVDVPAGATAVEASFDYLSPPKDFGDGFGKSCSITPSLLVLPLYTVVLYPPDRHTDDIPIRARVRVPAGWSVDAALRPQTGSDGAAQFPTVSLTTLLDSPILAGGHFRSVPLRTGPGALRLSVAADDPASLDATDAQLAAIGRLADEARALFGSRPHREFAFLVSLSSRLGPNGVEHHESTDVRSLPGF